MLETLRALGETSPGVLQATDEAGAREALRAFQHTLVKPPFVEPPRRNRYNDKYAQWVVALTEAGASPRQTVRFLGGSSRLVGRISPRLGRDHAALPFTRVAPVAGPSAPRRSLPGPSAS